MKKVVLDTSFILSCVRAHVDFLDEIVSLGLKPIFPLQVFDEIKGIIASKQKLKDRTSAVLALEILDDQPLEFVDLKTDNVDDGLVHYMNKYKSALLATLDRGLARRVSNRRLVLRQKKKLVII